MSGALPVIEFTPSIAITRGVTVEAFSSSSRCAVIVVPEALDVAPWPRATIAPS